VRERESVRGRMSEEEGECERVRREKRSEIYGVNNLPTFSHPCQQFGYSGSCIKRGGKKGAGGRRRREGNNREVRYCSLKALRQKVAEN
jgi:hypothetical protein